MEEIMTPSEVAALLKIHFKTVYNSPKKGVIPGNRIGRSWGFSRVMCWNWCRPNRWVLPSGRWRYENR